MDIEFLLQAVQAGGIVGLLLAIVVVGYRGDVVPKAWLDEIIPAIVAETLRQLQEQRRRES